MVIFKVPLKPPEYFKGGNAIPKTQKKKVVFLQKKRYLVK